METSELIENFELLEDWEPRYRYLIELGEALPPMDDILKTDAHKVDGCTSQVWMVTKPGPDGRFDFLADSDAHIVRGLIAVLRIIYIGKTPAEVSETDVAAVFSQLGLAEHLSPNRRNGFYAMVERIKGLAEATQQ